MNFDREIQWRTGIAGAVALAGWVKTTFPGCPDWWLLIAGLVGFMIGIGYDKLAFNRKSEEEN